MHHQLCRLIDDSIHPFTEQLPVCLTKEIEKNLLISLSQVFRQIQLWTHEFDSDSDNDMVVKEPDCNRKCSANDHDCLTKIIGDLILLLPIGSHYVQHLAGNILLAISNYVVAAGNWDEYMQSLCVCLELAICTALSHSLEHPTMKALVSKYELSNVVIALKPKLTNANWSSVACVIRVLRNILKNLKQNVDDQLLKGYLDSISSCFANVPWDSMNELHVGHNVEACRDSSGNAFLAKTGQLDSIIVFRGTLAQFFCSLVNQKGWMEASGGTLNKHPVICEISSLIPVLLAWCLGGDGDRSTCMYEYFRHKMLMLMIRLSFQMHLECSILVSWLKLIHEYFDDLLLLPMTLLESDQEDSLEGSPFLASVSDAKVRNMASRHLQRLAVFLFLRCSLSLVGLSDGTAEQFCCSNMKTCMTSDLNSDLDCCGRKKGLLELYGWLQGHLPAEIFLGCELYSERCNSFSLSFLRLFIHEDDILFEVLLQVFCVPFCAKQHAFQELKHDMLFHISNLLNPIHLFHLFLAELHYDHQVLLDYLISKDIGASSAEYLLRSLRIVCDSWNVFVDFSVEWKDKKIREMYKSSGKKRKALLDGSDFQGSLALSVQSSGIPVSLAKQCQKDVMYHKNHFITNRLSFENAKDCLLSLKKSVQSLHKKKLFPYNPEVLLRRLTRFQELCLKQ